MPLVSLNPATEEEIERYEAFSDADVDRCLDRSVAAFRRLRAASFDERARWMAEAATVLERRKRAFGELMTREMGKPVAQSVSEVEKCAWVCRYYAEHAERFLRDQAVETDAAKSYVAFHPLGPVLAVMPWNFPFWQVFRFAAPALMAGNTGLLKHASNVTGCSLAIADVFAEAGFPAGAFQALLVGSDAVEGIIGDARVKAATLTGSEGAGRAVGAAAGKAIKPSVLELGGSDPFVVLADADLDRAAEVGVTARYQNTGQSCIAAKRFIVEAPVWDAFTERFTERVAALKMDDPMRDGVDVGPLARRDLRDDVHDQVQRALAGGATLLLGDEYPDRRGFFYTPTVLAGVEPGTVAFTEEIFGPVASLIRARDVDHAVELANDTTFGLGGAVFTEDRAKGEAVALRLDVGCAFVNGMVKSDPRLPFGGVKASGYGRELSHFGIHEFVNVKTVWVGE